MLIRKLEDIVGGERDVAWGNGQSRRLLLARDNMGYSMTDTVIDRIAARLSVDENRVYLVGHSNGGMLAHRFAAERPERLAAVAPVSATIGGNPAKDEPEWRVPRPAGPIPIPDIIERMVGRAASELYSRPEAARSQPAPPRTP